MNYGMDSYLFGVDMERQTKIAKVITDFFERDGYRHGHFNWDGTSGYGDFTIGQAGANAVATYALLEEEGYKDLVKKVLQKAWDSKPIVGSQRYYDGLVHYLAMLHLTGNFKIWKKKPEIEKKTAEGEYNGVSYENDTTFHAFESCKLYEVAVTAKKAAPGPDTSLVDPDAIANALGYKNKITWETIQNPYMPDGMARQIETQKNMQQVYFNALDGVSRIVQNQGQPPKENQ